MKARPNRLKSRKHNPYSLKINYFKLWSHDRFFKFPVATLLQVILSFCKLLLFIRCWRATIILVLWNSVATSRWSSQSLLKEISGACTCTARTKKNIFYFLKKHFLSLNGDDGHIFCTIGVFVLVFPLSFYYSTEFWRRHWPLFFHKHWIFHTTPEMGKINN